MHSRPTEKQYSKSSAMALSESGTPLPSNLATPVPYSTVSLSQRFSNATEPSITRLAANGEFHQAKKSYTLAANVCAVQEESGNDPHGISNSASFEFATRAGYLPSGNLALRAASESGLPNSMILNSNGHIPLDSFLHRVSSQRLNRMPHRASQWDRTVRLLEGMYLLPSSTHNIA